MRILSTSVMSCRNTREEVYCKESCACGVRATVNKTRCFQDFLRVTRVTRKKIATVWHGYSFSTRQTSTCASNLSREVRTTCLTCATSASYEFSTIKKESTLVSHIAYISGIPHTRETRVLVPRVHILEIRDLTAHGPRGTVPGTVPVERLYPCISTGV